MGQTTIEIQPPDEVTPEIPRDGKGVITGAVDNPLGDIVPPDLMTTIQSTMEQIGELAAALQPASKAFTEFLEPRSIRKVEASATGDLPLQPNLSTTNERLHNVMMHLEKIVGNDGSQNDLVAIIENLKLASESIVTFTEKANTVADGAGEAVGKLNTNLNTTQAHIDDIAMKLSMNLNRLATLLDHANSAARDLSEGDGTAGKLLRDPELYTALLLTVQRLGDAVGDMQALLKTWEKEGVGVKLK
jgi:hypothetical protein